jgi:SAM-dependent methyltransferase
MVEQKQYFAADREFEDELSRLRLIEGKGDPFTTRLLTRLGVSTGWRCLEIGAGAGSIASWLADRVGPDGHVVATDIDPRFLRDLTAANVEVRRHDITQDDLEAEAFDLVHCRSLLVHIADPEAALRRMVAALRPGGWVLVDEPDFGTMAAVDDSHPLAEAFNKTLPVRVRFLADAGIMDGYLGKSLPSLMTSIGLVEVGNEGTVTVARGSDPASQNWMKVWARLDDFLLAEGALDQRDVADTRRALQDPSFWYRNSLVLGAWGQRPG